MAGRLAEFQIWTVEELVRRGVDEVGQLCGLKVGPKMKLSKALKRLEAGSAALAEEAPPAREPLSAELQEVAD